MGLVGGKGIRVVGVVDDGLEVGQFRGAPVVAAEEVCGLSWDGVLVTGLDEPDEVDGRLEQLGVPASRVWRLP